MDATYERILKAINKNPRTQRELARCVLMWTAYVREPLSIDDLALMISIKRDTKSLEDLKSSIPTEKKILDACANLISLDRSSDRYVRFVHFSVQEFLTHGQSKYIKTLNMEHEVAHREIAQACMIFLTLSLRRQDSLGQYTLHEWPHHLLAGDLSSLRVDDPMVTLTSSFFDTSPMALIKLDSKLRRSKLGRSKLEQYDIYLKFIPSVLALIFDLPGIHELWTSHGKQLEEIQLNISWGSWISGYIITNTSQLAMHYAAELDSIPVAQRLYKYGYTGNYSHSRPTSNYSIMPHTLQVSPLYSVRSAQMAKFLLDSGASTGPQYIHSTLIDPLTYFATWGTLGVEVLELLLDRIGAVDQNRKRFGHALRKAELKGNDEAVRLLLSKGADLDEELGNALQVAAFLRKVEAVQLLLDQGADVNAQGGYYGNALQAAAVASRRGNAEVIQLLLDKGADVQAQGGKYGSALQAAARVGNIRLTLLLLEKGANAKIKGGKYVDALQAAASKDHIGVIRVLLDYGADVNFQSGKDISVFRQAVYDRDLEVIQLLLDRAADPNTREEMYRNAWEAVVLSSYMEGIQLLLDRGADVNAPQGVFGTVLHIAAMVGELNVIQLLLNQGADVNAQGGRKGGNALHPAAMKGDLEVVRLLLDNGADVNAQDESDGTVLHELLVSSTLEPRTDIFPIVELLLDHGADITTYVPGSKYGDALTAAKAKWEQDRDSLDAFMKLVASRGKKGDLALRERKRDKASADSNEELEDSQ